MKKFSGILMAALAAIALCSCGKDGGEDNTKKGNLQITVGDVAFDMVWVEGGTFAMGSTDSDASSDESPVHNVTLSGFYVGKYEVTQLLWTYVMGRNPSWFNVDDNLPVEMVSWDDCQDFITKLNELTGKTLRLPTEAEWEYAARGGNKSKGYKYSGSDTIDDVAWYYGNSNSTTHPVGNKAPNELGIYDMSGNVWEWCQDRYGSYTPDAQTDPTGPENGSIRVCRGGSWYSHAQLCRCSYRDNSIFPVNRSYLNGLRLVLSE